MNISQSAWVITEARAALIAAIISALSAIIAVLVSVNSSRRVELRAAYRTSLAPHLAPLSEWLHECLAISEVITIRASRGQEVKNWIKRGELAKRNLETMRRRVGYLVPEIQSGMKEIQHAPVWTVSSVSYDPKGARERLDMLNELKNYIDKSVTRSYRRGRPISKRRGRIIKKKSENIRTHWDNRPKRIRD